MPPRPTKRPVLLDLIVFVAATAVALAWMRAYLQGVAEFPALPRHLEIQLMSYGQAPFLGMYSLALLIRMTLHRPRPPLRRLMRRPAMVACTVAALGFAIAAGSALARLCLRPLLVPSGTGPSAYPSSLTWSTMLLMQSGSIVAGAWLVLVLAFGWRRASDWEDRAGVGLGVGWIVGYVITLGLSAVY